MPTEENASAVPCPFTAGYAGCHHLALYVAAGGLSHAKDSLEFMEASRPLKFSCWMTGILGVHLVPAAKAIPSGWHEEGLHCLVDRLFIYGFQRQGLAKEQARRV